MSNTKKAAGIAVLNEYIAGRTNVKTNAYSISQFNSDMEEWVKTSADKSKSNGFFSYVKNLFDCLEESNCLSFGNLFDFKIKGSELHIKKNGKSFMKVASENGSIFIMKGKKVLNRVNFETIRMDHSTLAYQIRQIVFKTK